MATLHALQAWFAANPDTGAALFGLAIFLAVYLVRKLAPSLWLRFEALSPALSAEMSTFDVVAHKAFQALPSALAGLVVGPLLFGGDAKGALLGAMHGLLAPIGHELLRSYQGRLGIRKPQGPSGPSGSGSAGTARDMTDVQTPPDSPDAAMVSRSGGIQKVEIAVVISNQHPSRVARAFLAELSRGATVAVLLAPLVAGCSSGVPHVPQHPDPACSDEAYARLGAACAVKAAACVVKGGAEDECGAVCDEVADECEIVKALTAGDADKAALKTKALGQALALKQATRAAAKGAKKALGK